MVNRRTIVAACLLGSLKKIGVQAAVPPAAGHLFVELRVASDGDEMAFVPSHLTCPTAARVRLRFMHRGSIIDDPHDWVLLKPGYETRFLDDSDEQADEQHVVPPGDESMVIARTPMCPKGRTVTVEFRAPTPGDYPFVCSVAGHGRSMHGILSVTRRK